MKYEMIIQADTNDADYVTSITTVTEKQLDKIKFIANKIKKFKPYEVSFENTNYGTMTWTHSHNWPNGDCLRSDLGEKHPMDLYDLDEKTYEWFEEYLPFGEYGIHTIDSITITPYVKKQELL